MVPYNATKKHIKLRLVRKTELCLLVFVKEYYKLKGNRAGTRPELMPESIDLCAETVTEKLVSYTTQAERYHNDCVIGERTKKHFLRLSVLPFCGFNRQICGFLEPVSD